jgi:hypothetical protein
LRLKGIQSRFQGSEARLQSHKSLQRSETGFQGSELQLFPHCSPWLKFSHTQLHDTDLPSQILKLRFNLLQASSMSSHLRLTFAESARCLNELWSQLCQLGFELPQAPLHCSGSGLQGCLW